MYKDFIDFVRSLYPNQNNIPLHAPVFVGNEKKYLNQCIDTGYVSSVGTFVNQFEENIAQKLNVSHAIATSNGTFALHTCLILADVQQNDEVITQALTFVATCNAISYCNASPVFVDVSKETLGMCPKSLKEFLSSFTYRKQGFTYNKRSNKRVKACIPMHTFGHPCKIDKIKEICKEHNITLIEDAAESLGSTYKSQALGSFGDLAALSFNGNKIVTAGGGGAILTNNIDLAKKAKHLTTTAKIPHKWHYNHDQIGYNYRMPNINAALLCAQLENLSSFLENKRGTAQKYKDFFSHSSLGKFMEEPRDSESNYWLNAIRLNNINERDRLLKETNEQGVMTRPCWTLMNKLPMFAQGKFVSLENAETIEKTLVNIPSGVCL